MGSQLHCDLEAGRARHLHSLHPELPGSWDHGDQGTTHTEENRVGGWGEVVASVTLDPTLTWSRTDQGGAVRRAETLGTGPWLPGTVLSI